MQARMSNVVTVVPDALKALLEPLQRRHPSGGRGRVVTARQVGYWTATALTAFVFLSGGVGDLVQPAYLIEGMTHLGYPVYFVSLLGIWKVLGGVAVLAPGFARLKEWAYAGMLFDLSGAAASHAACGDPLAKVVTPLVILGIVGASWALRPDSRRLPEAGASELRIAAAA